MVEANGDEDSLIGLQGRLFHAEKDLARLRTIKYPVPFPQLVRSIIWAVWLGLTKLWETLVSMHPICTILMISLKHR